MNIDRHKKAKPRHRGKDVKTSYDLKRDRERAAIENAGLRARRAVKPAAAAKRKRRVAAA